MWGSGHIVFCPLSKLSDQFMNEFLFRWGVLNNLIHFDSTAHNQKSTLLQLKGERNAGNAKWLRLHHQSLHKDEREICGNKRVVNTLQKGTRAEEKRNTGTHSQKNG